jgi:hypothetical protein
MANAWAGCMTKPERVLPLLTAEELGPVTSPAGAPVLT